MGAKIGPSFTCLFAGYAEMLRTYAGTKPIMLSKYINDHIGTSMSTKNELEDLFNMSMTFIRL